MDMNWKSLAAMLPVQPCDDLKRDVLMGIYDMHDLGGDLILYHRESVGLADEIGQIMDPQDWAHWEQSKKRRWGARCTCTSCGEDFIAGYVKNGIVLAEGPDGQTYDGYAEQGPDSSVYGQTTLTYEAMVSEGTDTLRDKLGGVKRWTGLKVIFTAMEPQRRPQ